jgi:hypothetical protein
MSRCSRHPDRETRYKCFKHDVYMCEECMACRDPQIYCKFRTACAIWFLQKEKDGHRDGGDSAPDSENDSEAVPPQAPVKEKKVHYG